MVQMTSNMNDLKLLRAPLAPHVYIRNIFWCVHLVYMHVDYCVVHNVAFTLSSLAKIVSMDLYLYP